MTTTPADVFQANMPQIVESDAIEAAKSQRVVQSFNAHPIVTNKGKIDAIAVKLKFGNGDAESFLIAPYAATVLRMMLSHLENNKWTELAIIPPNATPRQ